jgi:hypothetical protein
MEARPPLRMPMATYHFFRFRLPPTIPRRTFNQHRIIYQRRPSRSTIEIALRRTRAIPPRPGAHATVHNLIQVGVDAGSHPEDVLGVVLGLDGGQFGVFESEERLLPVLFEVEGLVRVSAVFWTRRHSSKLCHRTVPRPFGSIL